MNRLIRFCDHGTTQPNESPLGCFGEIRINGRFFCYTVEQPWRDNRRFVSCIPAGVYDVVAYNSANYGEVAALVGAGVVVGRENAAADDRYDCLAHPANWSHQLQGCFAPGDRLAWGHDKATGARSNLMVTNSRNTLARLLPLLLNKPLSIEWKHGGNDDSK